MHSTSHISPRVCVYILLACVLCVPRIICSLRFCCNHHLLSCHFSFIRSHLYNLGGQKDFHILNGIIQQIKLIVWEIGGKNYLILNHTEHTQVNCQQTNRLMNKQEEASTARTQRSTYNKRFIIIAFLHPVNQFQPMEPFFCCVWMLKAVSCLSIGTEKAAMMLSTHNIIVISLRVYYHMNVDG